MPADTDHIADHTDDRADLLIDLARVRLLLLDFDGVLTDNRVFVDETGRESVACWRGDGIGLRAVERVGVEPIVVSTEPNPVVAARCAKLRVPCHQGIADKWAFVERLLRERGVPTTEVAFVGNDVNDAGCLARVGVPIVVDDAHADVLGLARYRTMRPGGRGAVREVCDLIVAARRGTEFPSARTGSDASGGSSRPLPSDGEVAA